MFLPFPKVRAILLGCTVILCFVSGHYLAQALPVQKPQGTTSMQGIVRIETITHFKSFSHSKISPMHNVSNTALKFRVTCTFSTEELKLDL